jgi:hypothetical protein
MQYRPDAAELLDGIATTLEEAVLAATDRSAQHLVRVAANLARIVGRELTLGPGARAEEQARLVTLLGRDDELAELRVELCRRLREDADGTWMEAAWPELVAIARDDLAIAKPGYDEWEDG